MLAATLTLALLAQPPATAPDEVCLTNACAPAPASLLRNEPAIAAALSARDLAALVRAGGTASEAADILRATCGPEAEHRCGDVPKKGTESWNVSPVGVVGVAGLVDPQDQVLPDGRVIPGIPNMVARLPGVEARPDMRKPPSPPRTNPINGVTPVTTPTVLNGQTVNVVTGYRQPDGTVIPAPIP